MHILKLKHKIKNLNILEMLIKIKLINLFKKILYYYKNHKLEIQIQLKLLHYKNKLNYLHLKMKD